MRERKNKYKMHVTVRMDNDLVDAMEEYMIMKQADCIAPITRTDVMQHALRKLFEVEGFKPTERD